MSVKSFIFGISLAAFVGPLLTVHAQDSMYDRVCPRVVKRFVNDESMWTRVNERIQKRFGFVCSKGHASQSSTTSGNVSSNRVNPTPVPTALSGSWGECDRFKQVRWTCTNGGFDCLATVPSATRECTFAEWKERNEKRVIELQEIETAMENRALLYSQQGLAGKVCLQRLHAITSDFLSAARSIATLTYTGPAPNLESRIDQGIRNFNAMPLVCF